MSLTEKVHAGEFLLDWDDSRLSCDNGTLITGQNLGAGTVLGQITKVQAAAPIPAIVGTGTGAMTLLTFGRAVQTGNYLITLLATSSTAAFSVVAPDGTVLPNGAVGTAYTSDHLNFLISNAGTMTLGDRYTVVVTAAGTPVVIGGTGTGTMSAVTLGPDAQNGSYKVVLAAVVANGGDFDVIAPDGQSIGRFLMGTGSTGAASFASRHVNFTLTDATDFILGDYFNIIVAAGSGKWTQLAPTAVDGSQFASGILLRAADATSADQAIAVVRRLQAVVGAALTWPASSTTEQQAVATAQLAKSNIILR